MVSVTKEHAMSDTKNTAKADIRFQTFAVVNKTTGEKARVHYSLDNRCDGRKVVTVYDKDYGRALGRVFANTDAVYENDTDAMTDYFDKGRVRIFETSSLYVEARKAVEAIVAAERAKSEARYEKRIERSRARQAARLGQQVAA
jgi:hypothetical protein